MVDAPPQFLFPDYFLKNLSILLIQGRLSPILIFHGTFFGMYCQKNKVMKKFTIILFIITLVSCKTLDRFTMFDLKYDASFIVPKNTIMNLPIDLTSPEVTTNTEEEFAIHDTRKDLIEEIKLKQLVLSIETPDYTFSFLESVEVYLRAEGLPEIKIAEKFNIPDDVGNQLEMDVTDKYLVEYLKKDKISMRVKTVTDEVLTEDIEVKIHSVFHVDAKILGL